MAFTVPFTIEQGVNLPLNGSGTLQLATGEQLLLYVTPDMLRPEVHYPPIVGDEMLP